MASNVENKHITVNIGFVGAGNMATAIFEGIIKSGIISPSQIYGSAPSEKHLSHWRGLGAKTTTINSEVVNNCPIVILAVKPQFAVSAIGEAFSKFHNYPFESIMVVSILVGVSCDSLKKMIYNSLKNKDLIDKIDICRSMPNTPALVGEGCTVYCFNESDRKDGRPRSDFSEAKSIVNRIFSVIGFCQEVPEKLINPIGALSGSGPAYVYLIIEALSDGAVKVGVPRDLAYQLSSKTLIGAAKMVLSTNKHPGQLKDEVCSPGGSTIAGITALEKTGVRYGLIQAVMAACRRSEEFSDTD